MLKTTFPKTSLSSISNKSPCAIPLDHTDSTTFIGKHDPINVSFHTKLNSNPVFICDINLRSLVSQYLLELLDPSKTCFMKLRQLFNSFLQSIQNKLNEMNTKLPEKADDDEMQEEALNSKLYEINLDL